MAKQRLVDPVPCFKVVRVTEDGTRVSFGEVPDNLILTYKKNKVTEAKVGGCMAFFSLRFALDLAFHYEPLGLLWEVWKAEGEEEVQVPLWLPHVASLRRLNPDTLVDALAVLWSDWRNFPYAMEWGNAPQGTCAFKKVVLKKKVHQNY